MTAPNNDSVSQPTGVEDIRTYEEELRGRRLEIFMQHYTERSVTAGLETDESLLPLINELVTFAYDQGVHDGRILQDENPHEFEG